MLDAVNSSTNGQTVSTENKAILGKDDFMHLMIAQLRNQDPLSPMDGTQFASQLAQFSSLEQLSNLNEAVNQSIEANFFLTQSINNTMTAALIGKKVKISGNSIQNTGQDKIEFGYNLPANAASVKINIYNENKVLIKTITNPKIISGENKLNWDFTDNEGNRVPEGKYEINVEAVDNTGESINVNQYIFGLIDGVRFTESGTKLLSGNAEYMLSDILEILNPKDEGGNAE
ncbi:MAG: flagellar hook assembly protein FlgD [Ignavibacteria bacterium]